MRIFICLVLLYSLFSCTNNEAEKDSPLLVLDSAASCPFITTDHHGNIVISYVRHINDSVSALHYRISEDGIAFSEPTEVAGSRNIHPHGENLPKVIFSPNGTILAAWGAESNDPRNKYAGVIYYTQSFDQGETWQKARQLVLDTTSYDQRYFDLALMQDGDVGIIWLDNREEKKQEGSSIYFSRTAGKRGFTGERCINESICPCCRTELFIDKSGNLHACYRDIINDSIRDMVHMVSSDRFKNFEQPERISADNWVMNGCPHTGPAMTETDKKLHFAWYTGEEPAGVYYCSSADQGKTFSQRDSVSSQASAKHPQITSFSKNRVAIVWDETVKSGDAYNSRIGLQIREENGKIISTEFISDAASKSEFPVLASPAGRLIVAFTQRAGDQTQVAYRFLRR